MFPFVINSSIVAKPINSFDDLQYIGSKILLSGVVLVAVLVSNTLNIVKKLFEA